MVNCAARLYELRTEKGLSQKDAAKDLGVSQALLSHYEKGIRECFTPFELGLVEQKFDRILHKELIHS